MKGYFVKLVSVIALIALVGGVLGCAKEEAPPTPAEYEWPEAIRVPVFGIGSSEYVRNLAWGTELEKATGCKVRLHPSSSTAVRESQAKTGMIPIHTATPFEWYPPVVGEPEFLLRLGGPYNIRSAMLSHQLWWIFYVRGDSPIKSWKDITPQTKIANYPGSAAVDRLVDILLAWCDIGTKADANVVDMGSYGAGCKSVLDGSADLAICASGSAYVKEVASGPKGIRVIELDPEKDPEAAARARGVIPYVAFGKTEVGIKEALGLSTTITVSFLLTRAETDPDFIYHYVKWMVENHDKYIEKATGFVAEPIESYLKAFPSALCPVHEGSIKYLKEIGVWTDEMEAENQAKAKLIKCYVDAYEDCIDKADESKINVDPENEEWVKLWESVKKTLPPLTHEQVAVEVRG